MRGVGNVRCLQPFPEFPSSPEFLLSPKRDGNLRVSLAIFHHASASTPFSLLSISSPFAPFCKSSQCPLADKHGGFNRLPCNHLTHIYHDTAFYPCSLSYLAVEPFTVNSFSIP